MPEWWVTIDVERQCAKCKKRLPSGSTARRTRDLERHMGGWICKDCG